MKPRPITIPLEDFESQWETIFGTKADKPQPTIEPIPFAGYVDIGEDTDIKAQEK
jgi:hypothetical protein